MSLEIPPPAPPQPQSTFTEVFHSLLKTCMSDVHLQTKSNCQLCDFALIDPKNDDVSTCEDIYKLV